MECQKHHCAAQTTKPEPHEDRLHTKHIALPFGVFAAKVFGLKHHLLEELVNHFVIFQQAEFAI